MRCATRCADGGERESSHAGDADEREQWRGGRSRPEAPQAPAGRTGTAARPPAGMEGRGSSVVWAGRASREARPTARECARRGRGATATATEEGTTTMRAAGTEEEEEEEAATAAQRRSRHATPTVIGGRGARSVARGRAWGH